MIIRVFSSVALLVFGTVFSAVAGEQYVDSSGYALSGYDVVAYFDLKQSPLKESQPEAVRGHQDYTHEYNGSKWAFSSAENLNKFKADPVRFVPQFDGHCSYGVSVGAKVPANPHLWRIVDGKLYLNKTKSVYKSWTKDVPGNITKADNLWSNLETKPASDSEIPRYRGALGPIAN